MTIANIYAHYDQSEKVVLWEELIFRKWANENRLWCVVGFLIQLEGGVKGRELGKWREEAKRLRTLIILLKAWNCLIFLWWKELICGSLLTKMLLVEQIGP